MLVVEVADEDTTRRGDLDVAGRVDDDLRSVAGTEAGEYRGMNKFEKAIAKLDRAVHADGSSDAAADKTTTPSDPAAARIMHTSTGVKHLTSTGEDAAKVTGSKHKRKKNKDAPHHSTGESDPGAESSEDV